jgi:hypothetical protein
LPDPWSTHSPTSLWTFGVNAICYRKKNSRNWKKRQS